MISLNNSKIDFLYYPNKEINILTSNIRINKYDKNVISFYFDDNSNIFELIVLKKYLDDLNVKNCHLFMPYMPYSRMDRIKNIKEHAFTLKYFSEIINSLNFEKVYTLDCHSNVGLALINNCINNDNFHELIYENNEEINLKIDEKTALVFPDLTAYKRYSYLIKNDKYIFVNKNRDFNTGKIIDINVYNYENCRDCNRIIIIDDLISRGNTFIKAAEKIKELLPNIKETILFVTHCEFTSMIENIENIKKAIDYIYTTNSMCFDSIYDEEYDFIKIFNCTKINIEGVDKNV